MEGSHDADEIRKCVQWNRGRKLGVASAGLGWDAGILNLPGGKPKGMHWRTFERLQAAHDAHTNRALAGMAAKLGILRDRLDG